MAASLCVLPGSAQLSTNPYKFLGNITTDGNVDFGSAEKYYKLWNQITPENETKWDAIEGYNKLIPFFEMHGDQESIDHIREIISDELNHAEILRGILSKYDGNIPTNES